jgi:hypothetical protein
MPSSAVSSDLVLPAVQRVRELSGSVSPRCEVSLCQPLLRVSLRRAMRDFLPETSSAMYPTSRQNQDKGSLVRHADVIVGITTGQAERPPYMLTGERYCHHFESDQWPPLTIAKI